MNADDQEVELAKTRRLIGQHPAALRSVSWQPDPPDGHLHHLELETKHGHVVVFDHQQPLIYSQPPRPATARDLRSWRDLTELAPEVFDGRPTIVEFHRQNQPPAWIISLSTGARLKFQLHPTNPLLSLER